MEPTEPAALAAAGLLAASTVNEQGGQAGTRTWAGQAQLAGLVQQAVTGRDLAAVLEEVTARPQDPAAVSALAQVLAAVAAQDRSFRGELAQLVGQAEHDPVIGGLATTIGGHARVGKLVTIGQAGSVHVHLPPPPPQTLLDRLHRAAVSGPLVVNLPPRNPTFTGRAELLDQLHETLRPGQAAKVIRAQVLHGLGGVGKTQLALEYAHRYAADYDLVWWVVAEQSAAIPGQLVALARRLGIHEAANQAETVAVLYDELRGRDRWLLVFDNAEDPADLRPWWPPDAGRVLVTSRHPGWSGLAATIGLDVLPRSEAISFLQRRLGRDDAAFDQLTAALGDLPLALEQAAAYLDETAAGVADYLDLLRDRAEELFALGRPAATEQTIATTWRVALLRLRSRAPVAEDLLVLCAFLAPDNIPRTLLTDHPDVLPASLAAAVRDRLGLQQAVAALRRYSLVAATEETLGLHRLVQAVTRQQLDPEQVQQWAAVALELMTAAFPQHPGDPDAWPQCVRLLPHVLAACDHAAASVTEPDAAAGLLTQAARYLWSRAELQQATLLLGHALAIREARLGPDHPATAQSLNSLAAALRGCNDLTGARTQLERALAIQEAHFGPDHPKTAEILNNLATVLRAEGNFHQARTLLERALAIREAQLGRDHPETAQSLHSLAAVRRDQGDLDQARTLYEHAVAIREARLGPDHPDTAQSLNNLAFVLREQGDLDQARSLHERALTIRETRFGPDHPETAQSLHSLAAVLHDQGDLQGARPLYERALAIYEARLGADHPDTVRSRQNLAAVVAALDKQQ